jgi:hypothetical protein
VCVATEARPAATRLQREAYGDHEWCKAEHRRIARRTQNTTDPATGHDYRPHSSTRHRPRLQQNTTYTEKGGGRGNLLHASGGHRPRLQQNTTDPAYAAQATASAFPSHLYLAFAGRVGMRRRRSARDGFLPLPPTSSFGAVLTFSERALGGVPSFYPPRTRWRLSALNAARLYPSSVRPVVHGMICV